MTTKLNNVIEILYNYLFDKTSINLQIERGQYVFVSKNHEDREDTILYKKNLGKMLIELGHYFNGNIDKAPNIIFPENNLGQSKQYLARHILKLDLNQKEIDLVYLGLFQSIPISDLMKQIIYKNNLCLKNIPSDELWLKLMMINLDSESYYYKERYNREQLFVSMIKLMGAIRFTENTKSELLNILESFLKPYQKIIQNPNQLNFFFQPQKTLVEFFEKKLNPNEMKLFQHHVSLHSMSINNVEQNTLSLFDISEKSTSLLKINHEILVTKITNIFLKKDIQNLIQTINDLFLKPENKTALELSDVIVYGSNDLHTDLLLISNSNIPINTLRFQRVYEQIAKKYVNSDNKKDPEFLQKLFLHALLESDLNKSDNKKRNIKI